MVIYCSLVKGMWREATDPPFQASSLPDACCARLSHLFPLDAFEDDEETRKSPGPQIKLEEATGSRKPV